ncbi:MAG: STAS domain-containing protein [Oscillospiraceae bacterium]|nr:STAS domain-containing protein [Oscillospiraceae bacterium]
MLNINKTTENGKAVFSLDGRLDTVTAPDLEKALRASLDGVKELTLNFEKLDYISSAGLRVLLSTQKLMAKQGSMKLVHVGETILEIFEVTGFSEILTIE